MIAVRPDMAEPTDIASQALPHAPWRILKIHQVSDPRGTLGIVESNSDIPFGIARVFYIHGVPQGARRAGHALKTCHEFLFAMSGSFKVRVSDGHRTQTLALDRPEFGLYLPAMTWVDLFDFSADCVCMVLASEPYNELGHVGSFDEFRAMLSAKP